MLAMQSRASCSGRPLHLPHVISRGSATSPLRLVVLGAGPPPSPPFSRARRALVSTAGIGLTAAGLLAAGAGTAVVALSAAGSASASSGADAQALVRAGMRKFEAGDVEGSLADFDAALAARPSMRPYLWQRGLTLYYIGTKDALEEGARQFRDDVAVNPNDTEEAIWTFLCESKLVGPEAARQQFLTVGRDSRPVMRAAYECFKNGSDPEAIIDAAGGDARGHAAFYSRLYVGLWHEAEGDEAAAKAAVLAALDTDYARGSGDYMAALAGVHATRRGWA